MGFFSKKPKHATDEFTLPQDIYQSGLLELKDVIAPSALEIQSSMITIGDRKSRSLFILSYPRFLSGNWFSGILNLPSELDVSLFIHPINTGDILTKLRKKVAEVQSQINDRAEKGLVRDPLLDTAYQDLEDLRDKLQQARERLFNFGLYITIYGKTKEELEKLEADVRSLLESRLVLAKPALFQQREAMESIFPFGTDELNVNKYLNSSPVSSVFPFSSFDLTANKGILFGVNRHNNSLVLFDRFSLENYNSVLFAKSGSGKSYMMKLEILRTLMLGAEVIVIDPEREYEYLAESVGGRVFNISLTSKHHINPFDLPLPHDDESGSDVLRSHIISLVGLFRLMLSGITPEEDAILDRAITETYAAKDITPDNDFAGRTPPLLSDLELILSNMEGGESLATRLRKYTSGTWAGFINQHSNVDMNQKLVVFSVRDMQDELRPVATYLIVQYVWSAIRRELKKRLLVVDEAWWLMRSEDGASFLYGIAKRARKYYLGLATITQDVADFMESPYGKPIITNSSIQILLKQSPGTIDAVQKTFTLTDEEKFLLLESDIGEGIFFAGLKHVAIKVIASYTEHQIITSDPSELLRVKTAKAGKPTE